MIMFKFDFDIEDVDDELAEAFKDLTSNEDKQTDPVDQQNFTEISLDDLLDHLPPQISFSPIHVPALADTGKPLTLYRRDLFDARFQLIAESEGKDDAEAPEVAQSGESSALEFVEAPSDLVAGIYEGGLKTWECSIDLVGYLDSLNIPVEQWQGRRILEIGCGTAIPCLYLLQRLFSEPGASNPETHIHLQDYNDSVLRLVTIPNLILAWHKSDAATSYRNLESTQSSTSEPILDEGKKAASASSDSDSELEITPELKTAFVTSLKEYGIHLRFFSGSWEAFDLITTGATYDTVLTSETVYRTDNLPSLVNLMQSASTKTDASGSVPKCLVAAKMVYFGVGGGVSEFVDAVGRAGGAAEPVWETHFGVSRNIMRVKWH